MKLIEILLEAGGLDAIINTPEVLSQYQHLPEQAVEIKRLLSRHALVTGHSQGRFLTNGMAWSGPINSGNPETQWTPALTDAISRWKRSVNIQLETAGISRQLNTAGPGVITASDLLYLMNTDLDDDGFLRLRNPDRPTRSRSEAPPFDGQTYIRQLAQNSSEGITDIRSMVNAIGWSGWYRLAWAVADDKGMTDDVPTRNRWAQRFILEAYSNLRSNTEFWIDNWNKNQNTLGNQDRIINDINLKLPNLGSDRPTPAAIFDLFADLLRGLWAEDLRGVADVQSTNARAEEGSPILEQGRITALARTIADAMGGNYDGTSEEPIQESLSAIRSRGDWDNLTQEFNRLTGDVLHERLYDELKQDRDEYTSIVSANLRRINVINHQLLHSLINFENTNEVEVELDGTVYSVQQQRVNDEIVIENYSDFNDIVIDRILRAALEQQGTTVPTNMRVPVQAEDRQVASAAFIAAVEESYPEMVAWYTYQEPFNEPGPDGAYPDLGGMRLEGIIDQASQMSAAGSLQAYIIDYIKSEISKDRGWLVGTSETDPGHANIRFASEYVSEGESGRFFNEVTDDDLVELSDEDEELIDNLRSEQEAVRREALETILNDANRESFYIRIYQGMKRIYNKYLDTELGDEDTLENYIRTGSSDDSLLGRAIDRLRTPIAAPMELAKLFKKAADGDSYFWGLFTIGTDDDLMNRSIDQIRSRSDYNLVDARYRQIPGISQSLLEDMGNEEFLRSFGDSYYNRLASSIGASNIAMVEAEVSARLRERIEDIAGGELSEDALRRLEEAIELEGTIEVRKINPLLIALDGLVAVYAEDASTPSLGRLVEIRNAFMAYRRRVMPPGWRPGRTTGKLLNGAEVLALATDTTPEGTINGRPPTEIRTTSTTASAAPTVTSDEREFDPGPMP
jgi:hypothetical protein